MGRTPKFLLHHLELLGLPWPLPRCTSFPFATSPSPLGTLDFLFSAAFGLSAGSAAAPKSLGCAFVTLHFSSTVHMQPPPPPPSTVINLYCKLASFFNPVGSTPTPSFVKHFCSGRKLSPYSSLLGVLFFLKAFYIVSKITHFQFLVVGSALKDVRLHFLLSSTSLHFSLSTETQVQSLPCLVRHKVLNSC